MNSSSVSDPPSTQTSTGINGFLNSPLGNCLPPVDEGDLLSLLQRSAHQFKHHQGELIEARTRERALADVIIRMARESNRDCYGMPCESLGDQIEHTLERYARQKNEAAKAAAEAPPVDNAHVAEGCERFGGDNAETVASEARS